MKDDVFKFILPQLAHAKIELYIAAEFFETFTDYREQIISALREYTGNINMKAVPQIKRLRSADQSMVDDLLDLWEKNGKLTEPILKKIKGEGA